MLRRTQPLGNRIFSFGVVVWVVLLAFSAACDVQAADLKLSTVRIDLSDKQSSLPLTITNGSPERTVVHMRVMRWTQANGTDELEPTNEILANPPIAEIAGGGRQLLRIGFSGKQQGPTEKTYRLFIEEVPLTDEGPASQIRTYLKISVPIFIPPTQPSKEPLQATLTRSAAGEQVVAIRNTRNQHVRIASYSLVGSSAPDKPVGGLYYVLPGAETNLPLASLGKDVGKPSAIKITTDEGVLELPLGAR